MWFVHESAAQHAHINQRLPARVHKTARTYHRNGYLQVSDERRKASARTIRLSHDFFVVIRNLHNKMLGSFPYI